ncbi:MAG: peptide chain release factor 2 [Patescibacteria group bacterium]|jgi:peptide chain release factor 2
MSDGVKELYESMRMQLDQLQGFLDRDKLTKENEELATEMSQPDFWKDQQTAAAKGAKFEMNKKIIEAEAEIGEILARVGEAVNPTTDLSEELKVKSEKLMKEDLAKAGELITWLEAQTLFSGTYDDKNAYVMFHVGTGGVDAADWNGMLLNMYLAYAKRKEWKTEIMDITEGGEAGVKNATLKITGFRAYGWLKSEAGVHRLIRISPFNAQGLRQTSFALIEVLPDLGDVDVKIKDEDLKIETFKSSGCGGQSVNTTDSAVRITHIPTNLVVSIQTERSQTQNKEVAMKILKNRLYLLEQEQRDAENRKLKASNVSGDFGRQIRTFTLHPYQQVKDHRSDFETSQTEKVLKEGDLDELISSVLLSYRKQDKS